MGVVPKHVGGVGQYYKSKIDELEIALHEKTENLKRLEAQRNALNNQGEFFSVFVCCCSNTQHRPHAAPVIFECSSDVSANLSRFSAQRKTSTRRPQMHSLATLLFLSLSPSTPRSAQRVRVVARRPTDRQRRDAKSRRRRTKTTRS
jgi:hypothetical protein